MPDDPRPSPVVLAALARRGAIRASTGEALGALADVSDHFGLERLRLGYEVIPPGHRTAPAHRHTATEEMVVVLEGRVRARRGDDVFDLGPGMALGFPPTDGPCHEVRNVGDGPAVVLSIAALDPHDRVTFEDAEG